MHLEGFAPGARETTPSNKMLNGACAARVIFDPDGRVEAYKKSRVGGRRRFQESVGSPSWQSREGEPAEAVDCVPTQWPAREWISQSTFLMP